MSKHWVYILLLMIYFPLLSFILPAMPSGCVWVCVCVFDALRTLWRRRGFRVWVMRVGKDQYRYIALGHPPGAMPTVLWCRGAGVQRCWGAEVLECRDAGVQRCKGEEVLGCRGARVQRWYLWNAVNCVLTTPPVLMKCRELCLNYTSCTYEMPWTVS